MHQAFCDSAFKTTASLFFCMFDEDGTTLQWKGRRARWKMVPSH